MPNPATAAETQYLINIRYAIVDYLGDQALKERVGTRRNARLRRVKGMLLIGYLDYMEQYMRTTVVGDGNFCTAAEANTVMRHINDICGTSIWVVL